MQPHPHGHVWLLQMRAKVHVGHLDTWKPQPLLPIKVLYHSYHIGPVPTHSHSNLRQMLCSVQQTRLTKDSSFILTLLFQGNNAVRIGDLSETGLNSPDSNPLLTKVIYIYSCQCYSHFLISMLIFCSHLSYSFSLTFSNL